MLFDFLFYHLFYFRFQTLQLDIYHTLHNTFLLEKVVQVVK